ncbi:MAG: metallophosphoesterase family protein [Candidatus Omnitrophica bacterium]|nr:metallophosphoesterase family protein [Candidatus Omnitrophota bacterium]
MKRIALVADIHGNLPAFKSVLSDIKRKKISEIWNLGDSIGYGPFPDETIRMLARLKIKSILGNYDAKVLSFPCKIKKWKKSKDPVKFFSFQWTYRHLSASGKRYLRALPHQIRTIVEGKKCLLVHGSPQFDDEPLTHATPTKRFAQLAKKAGADIVLCAHSHRYFSKKAGKVLFVNPGSVGRPFDGNPKTSYATITLRGKDIRVKNFRISYDTQLLLRKMTHERFPEKLSDSIMCGVSLDDLDRGTVPLCRSRAIARAQALAQAHRYQNKHSRQVTKLALVLFDQLRALHALRDKERLYLELAALLHDVGYSRQGQPHHKASFDIIRASELPIGFRGRLIVGLIARYHRKSLPKESHKYFALLTLQEKDTVRKLSALLRIADGLDRSHVSAVREIHCRIVLKRVVVRIKAGKAVLADRIAAYAKSDLFEKIFKKRLVIR